MGIYLALKNQNEDFASNTHKIPMVLDYDELTRLELLKRKAKAKTKGVVINDMSSTSSEDRKRINESLYTQYSNDNVIDTIPTCRCLTLYGRFRLGRVCEVCGTEVSNKYDDSIESLIWIKAPKGIPALIPPLVWSMLSKRFMAEGKFDTIRWLCDTNYIGPQGKPDVIAQLEAQKIPRGLINFYNHFDEIMETLFSIRALRNGKTKSTGRDETKEFVERNRDLMFCDVIPMPSKLLMVVEKTSYATYLDTNITGALDALWSMAGIDNEYTNIRIRQKENRTAKAIALLAKYHSDVIKKVYMSKEGVFRDHIYSCRANYSIRCVISSETDPHRYGCIKIPWAAGVITLRYYLINKLWRRGWQPKRIKEFLRQHETKHHPLLEALFKEIIAEYAPYDGIPCIAVRYPSLKRGSMQLFYIDGISLDPTSVTVKLPILVVRPFNADFDGDAMTFNLLLDRYMTEGMRTLEPHFSAFNLAAPRTISSDVMIPKPLMATMGNWIYHDKPVDPAKRDRMLSRYT